VVGVDGPVWSRAVALASAAGNQINWAASHLANAWDPPAPLHVCALLASITQTLAAPHVHAHSSDVAIDVAADAKGKAADADPTADAKAAGADPADSSAPPTPASLLNSIRASRAWRLATAGVNYDVHKVSYRRPCSGYGVGSKGKVAALLRGPSYWISMDQKTPACTLQCARARRMHVHLYTSSVPPTQPGQGKWALRETCTPAGTRTPARAQVVGESARVRQIHDAAEVFDAKAETSFKYLQVRPPRRGSGLAGHSGDPQGMQEALFVHVHPHEHGGAGAVFPPRMSKQPCAALGPRRSLPVTRPNAVRAHAPRPPARHQVCTACANAFAHGSNEVANAVGPLAAIYQVGHGLAANTNTGVGRRLLGPPRLRHHPLMRASTPTTPPLGLPLRHGH
jgi:hypothetical protein